jgi:hypothetical protein
VVEGTGELVEAEMKVQLVEVKVEVVEVET